MNDSSARKVKKVKGRTNNEVIGEEENSQIIVERKKDIGEDEENILRKQKKIGEDLGMTEENVKQRREVMEKTEEGENGDLEFEDDYDDEWGKNYCYRVFCLTLLSKRRKKKSKKRKRNMRMRKMIQLKMT